MREALACLSTSSGSVDTSARRSAAWQHDSDCARRFKTIGSSTLSAPHLHIFGICYERHNVTRHVGAPWVSRWRDAGASYTDVPKEQNAYPISRSGHSTASVPWPSSFIEFIRQFSHAAE